MVTGAFVVLDAGAVLSSPIWLGLLQSGRGLRAEQRYRMGFPGTWEVLISTSELVCWWQTLISYPAARIPDWLERIWEHTGIWKQTNK